jgi:hypothetical protein
VSPRRAPSRPWQTYPEIYLKHIAWNHEPQDKGSFVRSVLGVRRVEQEFECTCGWGVIRLFTTRFVRMTRQPIYHHPPGYSPCPSKAEARREWFLRHPPGTAT